MDPNYHNNLRQSYRSSPLMYNPYPLPPDQTPVVPNGSITVGEISNIPDIRDLNTSTQSMSSNNNVNSPQKELLAPPSPNQNAYQVGVVNYANNLVPPPPDCMNQPVTVTPVCITPAGNDDAYQVPVTAYRLIDNVISVLRDVQDSLASLKGTKRFMSIVNELRTRLQSLYDTALAITATSTTPIDVRKLARFQSITERDEYSYMLALNTQLTKVYKENWDCFSGLHINFCTIAKDFFDTLQSSLPILSLHKYCEQLANSLPLSVSHDPSLKGVVYAYVLCSAMENEMKRCYIQYFYPSLMEEGVNFCRVSRLKTLFWEDLNRRLTYMGAGNFFEDTKYIHTSLSKEVYFFNFNDESSFTTDFGIIMNAFFNMVRAYCPFPYYSTLDTSRHNVEEIWKSSMNTGFVSQRTVHSLIVSIATFQANAYEGYKSKDKNRIMDNITKCVPLLENLKIIERNYGIKSNSYSELVKYQLQSMANASL